MQQRKPLSAYIEGYYKPREQVSTIPAEVNMGEAFEQAKPLQPIESADEHLSAGPTGRLRVEQFHRYLLARHLSHGLDVLEIASGEGYGASLLAQTARSVVGIEIDAASVEHSRTAYVAPNLRFEHASAQAIPLPNRSVDCIVSFKTMEHFHEHEQFLAEVRRILLPGGKLIISSPDSDVDSPLGGESKPHDLRALTRHEFAAVLKNRFDHVVLCDQRPVVGSVIVPQNGTGDPLDRLTFERRTDERFEATGELISRRHLIAIASTGAPPHPPESFYFETTSIEDVVAPSSLRLRNRALQEDTGTNVNDLEEHTKSSQGELLVAKKHIRELASQLRRLDDAIAGKDMQIAEYLYHLNRMNASGWWRLGKWLDKLILAPLALFRSHNPKQRAAAAEAKAQSASIVPPTHATSAPDAITLPAAKTESRCFGGDPELRAG